jgi:hypothetical protein
MASAMPAIDADHFADQRRLPGAFFEQSQGSGSAVDPGLAQRALHHFEFVGPLAELAQFDIHLPVELPNTGLTFVRQTEPLKGSQSSDP